MLLHDRSICQIGRELIDNGISILKAKFSLHELIKPCVFILLALSPRTRRMEVIPISRPFRSRFGIFNIRDVELLTLFEILNYTLCILNSRELHLLVLIHELRNTPLCVALIPSAPLYHSAGVIFTHQHFDNPLVELQVSLIIADCVQ